MTGVPCDGSCMYACMSALHVQQHMSDAATVPLALSGSECCGFIKSVPVATYMHARMCCCLSLKAVVQLMLPLVLLSAGYPMQPNMQPGYTPATGQSPPNGYAPPPNI